MLYTDYYNTIATPQSEPIAGRSQVQNSAGGFVFELDKWARLDRFLILGSEGNTYYASARKLTRENAVNVLACIQEDGLRAVRRIVEVSESGRAPKNDPAIFALALAAKLGQVESTRRAAFDAVNSICRIGTHIFTFAENVQQLGGWGRGMRRAVAGWYESKTTDALAYQLVKYQQRNGWSHRDLLRLSHPKSGSLSSLYAWICGKAVTELPAIVEGFNRLQSVGTAKDAATVIEQYKLPHECVPTQFKSDPIVQSALLTHMPITAMIRNLASMTKSGLLKPLSSECKHVVTVLSDEEHLHAARVHPIHILAALKTYEQGHGGHSTSTWTPVRAVCAALDSAFYRTFKNVEPTNKNMLLAIDVSGSMHSGSVSGIAGLTPAVSSAAMAMIIAHTEPNHHFVGFSHKLVDLNIHKQQSLAEVIAYIREFPMGGTDCALPMLWAAAQKVDVDCFTVLTDCETWFGRVHPCQALANYRRTLQKPDAKSVVIGMTATEFTIADPSDSGMLDVVGFDAATPQVISDFLK